MKGVFILDKPVLTLGQKMKNLRLENGYTQKFVAEQLSVTRSAYSYYETDKTSPDRASLGILAKIFAVDVTYLIYEENYIPTFNDNNIRSNTKPAMTMGALSQDERELIAAYRRAKPSLQRKIRITLQKEIIKPIVHPDDIIKK